MTEAPFHELSQKDRVAQCLEAVYKATPDTARHILEVEREHKARDGNNWEEKTLTEKMTSEQARQVLRAEEQAKQAERQKRLDACQKAVQPFLDQATAEAKKFGFVIIARPHFTPDGRTEAGMVFVDAT